MGLREKIAAIIVEALGDHGIDYGNVKGELTYVEDILAIPELADALFSAKEIETLANSINRIANDIPPPNDYTPRLMMLVVGLRSELHGRLSRQMAKPNA